MACEVCKKPYVPEDYDFDSDRKPHECSICGKGFSLKIQLKRHMLLHEGNVPYVCDACEKHLDQTSSYNLRLSKKGDFYCETCGKGFTTKRSLLRHASEHTLESILNCDECGESFKNATALKRHSATHKTRKRGIGARNYAHKELELNFTCEECGKCYSDFTEFELHCASHLKKMKCDKCNVYFNSNKVLEDHKKSCGDSDASVKKVGASNSCKHICNICTKSFTRKSALEGHMFSHYEEENHESPVEDDSDKDVDFKCDTKTDKPSKSNKPIIDEPAKELCLPKLKIRRSVKCEKCNVMCTSKKVLKIHMASHETPPSTPVAVVEAAPEVKKMYKCRICSEEFDLKEAYKKHKMTHRGMDEASKDNVAYTCALCQKVFSKKKHLKKHIRNHLDNNNVENNSEGKKQKRIKNFACTHCGKRFVGETCLKKHERKHVSNSNEDSNSNNNQDGPTKMRKSYKKPKPLICEFCNEDFTGRRHAYMKHKLGHTPEVCGICDARFQDRASLREHCRIHIGTEEGRRFLECSQKALAAKNGLSQPDAKVEYIYLVLR